MKAHAAVILLFGLASAPVLADCSEPVPITSLPNGTTATKEAMIAAMHAMQAYDAAVKSYVQCMRSRGVDPRKPDAVVDELTKTAERFNNELRAFKAKSSS